MGRFRKLSLMPLCAAGFFVGIFMNFWWGQGSALLTPAHLCRVKEGLREAVDAKRAAGNWSMIALVGMERIRWVALLILAGTTYLAPFGCMGAAAWLGISLGTFLAGSLCQYGIKGIVLVTAALFPQWLLYGPAFWFLINWCAELYGAIYHKSPFRKREGLVKLAFILLLILAGIVMESTWNPGILMETLVKF